MTKAKSKGKRVSTQAEEPTRDDAELIDSEGDDDDGESARYLDPEIWVTYIENEFEGKSHAQRREYLAHCLAHTREALQTGPEAIPDVIRALSNGIAAAFDGVPAYDLCLKLFEMGQLGYVRDEDELSNLVTGAIERAEQERDDASKERRALRKVPEDSHEP